MKDIKIEKLVTNALIEDAPFGDLTTDNLIDKNQYSEARIVVKEDGIVSGLKIAKEVFRNVDEDIEFLAYYNDGDKVAKGAAVATVSGATASILLGERVALNFLQKMSGIATMTNKFVEEIEEFETKIADTRKTTPGLRFLEKMAVRHGGAANHRFSLSDAVMIKDNHVAAAGSVTNAIEIIKSKVSHTVKIEVEVESLEQFEEALEANADIIMLDNVDCEVMKQAVDKRGDKTVIIEASGNMTLERLKDVANTGVDIISVGAITHSAKFLDISLKFT